MSFPALEQFVRIQIEQNDLPADDLSVMVEVLKAGATPYENKAGVWEVFTDDLMRSRQQRTIISGPVALSSLLRLPTYRVAAEPFLSRWFPTDSPQEWLNWDEASVSFTLSLIVLASPLNESVKDWFVDSTYQLTLVTRGSINFNLPYQGQSSRYLELLMETAASRPDIINWENAVWDDDQLFSVLPGTVRNEALSIIHRKCSVDNSLVNNAIMLYSAFDEERLIDACAERFAYCTGQDRQDFMARLQVASESIQNTVINALVQHQSILLEHIGEMPNWAIDSDKRELLCIGAIDSAEVQNLLSWISNGLPTVVSDDSHWPLRAIKRAWLYRHDIRALPPVEIVKEMLTSGVCEQRL